MIFARITSLLIFVGIIQGFMWLCSSNCDDLQLVEGDTWKTIEEKTEACHATLDSVLLMGNIATLVFIILHLLLIASDIIVHKERIKEQQNTLNGRSKNPTLPKGFGNKTDEELT